MLEVGRFESAADGLSQMRAYPYKNVRGFVFSKANGARLQAKDTAEEKAEQE